MTQPPQDTTGHHATPQRDKLIESIYRIALQPQTYDRFMGEWDSYISAQMTELAALEAAAFTQSEALAHPEILAHFKIAAQLLDQIGRPLPASASTGKSKVRDLQMLVDDQGRIVWSTGAAAHLFGVVPGAQIDRLGLAAGQLEALRALTLRRAHRHADRIRPGPLLLQVRTSATDEVVHMMARPMPDQDSESLVMITRVASDWPAAMPGLLREGFALSPTEIDISELIADGKGPAEIAQARKSAVATVRTQIKSIMSKTHCSTQAELVQLLHSVMRVADHDAAGSRRVNTNADRITMFNLPDRTMPVAHFGDPTGYPVVYFHAMLDGNTVPKKLHEGLHRHNLHLICPVRPFFGHAAGDDAPTATAPGRFGADVARLIDHMNLKMPIFLGHMAGILYAYAAANVQPKGRLRAILSVAGGVPIISRDQFASMSRRQRLVAYTARYTPAILPFVLRAGISQIDNGGERQFLHSLYENSRHDLPVIADPEIRDLIYAGYRFTAQQGPKAFEIGSLNIVQDWSDIVDGSTVPIRMLAGESDPVVSLSSVRAFAAQRRDRVSLEVLEDTGQLILYKRPDLVIREICALRDRG